VKAAKPLPTPLQKNPGTVDEAGHHWPTLLPAGFPCSERSCRGRKGEATKIGMNRERNQNEDAKCAVKEERPRLSSDLEIRMDALSRNPLKRHAQGKLP
jgi:hypothetical protein